MWKNGYFGEKESREDCVWKQMDVEHLRKLSSSLLIEMVVTRGLLYRNSLSSLCIIWFFELCCILK